MGLFSKILIVTFALFSETVVAQDGRADLVDNLISDLYKRHLFNGAVVIGQKGRLLFSKGFGYANFMNGVPFTPLTASDGGSNAKTFTALSVLLLAEQNKLKLEDPVQKYLPNYPYPNTTVGNLITHSVGGLPDYDYFFEKAPDTAIVTTTLNLDLISKIKPDLAYPPNTNFYYDNVGFDLAALVVERVTGITYNEFLKQKIFGPLRMDSSFVRPALFANWKPNRAVGYRYENDSLKLFDIADREGFYGGCNIWFTATDLYRWGQSFYRNSIVGNSMIRKVTFPVSIHGKLSYVRLGAWYRGKSKSAFYYWGNVAGFYSWVYWDRNQQFTIAFMTNTAIPQWVRPQLTSALIDIIQGKPFSPITEPKVDPIDRKNLGQITGTYEIQGFGNVQISAENSKVILTVPNGMEYRMHLVDKKTFYIPGFDPWISFSSIVDGKFQNIYWNSTVLQTTGKRIGN